MAERHRPGSSCTISRRRFLKGIGGAAAGFLVADCLPKQVVEAPGSEASLAPPIPPTIPSTSSLSSKVAIAQVESYDRTLVRQQAQALLDGLGGLDDLIRSEDRVAIKVNLVGGSQFKPWPGVSAIESYVTHPGPG